MPISWIVTTDVPAGWRADPAPEGIGIDLRVAGAGRSRVIGVFVVLCGLATWAAQSDWHWLFAAAPLAALALWCAVGDELWHLETNRLVHRVGTERFAWSRAYSDADLTIEHRTSKNYNVPYSRLYAVVKGRKNFLFDRRHSDEIRQLAEYISTHTGWRVV